MLAADRLPIAPIPSDSRPRRIAQLLGGIVLFGISTSLLLLSRLGLDPWDVFHQGLARRFGLGVGNWTIIVSCCVLLLWWPLHQRPGLGTLTNAVLVGLVVDTMLAVFGPPSAMPARVACLVVGVLLNGVATGAYIGAGLGPGPRDGLTIGLHARGYSIRVVRTCIELSVLCVGWILGGTVGVGTVIYALAIGPLMHITVPALRVRGPVLSEARATT